MIRNTKWMHVNVKRHSEAYIPSGLSDICHAVKIIPTIAANVPKTTVKLNLLLGIPLPTGRFLLWNVFSANRSSSSFSVSLSFESKSSLRSKVGDSVGRDVGACFGVSDGDVVSNIGGSGSRLSSVYISFDSFVFPPVIF